jgi:hypothetical protein
MLKCFAGLRFEIPEDWMDISADLAPGSPPTLAPRAGVGVLQVSIAEYQGGSRPYVKESDLNALFRRFCEMHSLTGIQPSTLPAGSRLGVGGISNTDRETIAIWYLSNGTDVVLVTYTSLEPQNPATVKELARATEIVKSTEFPAKQQT